MESYGNTWKNYEKLFYNVLLYIFFNIIITIIIYII